MIFQPNLRSQWINLIELTPMILIEPSQLNHSLQNCDNSFALVWWIELMILNLFYNLFVQFYLCSATKLYFSLGFAFMFCVFAFFSSAYQLFVEISLTVYKWIKVGTKLCHISELTLVNLVLHNFLVLFVLNRFDSHYHLQK